MTPELITLHISQLLKAFEISKTNKYSDPRKEQYHKNLCALVEKINSLDLSTRTYEENKMLKKIIDFCFYSIEFLDNSTLVNIPYELVYCLEKALKNWIDTDKYIIVTSLQNDLNSFSFNPFLALNVTYYDLIEAEFEIVFEYRMIQINLPKYLANDYLSNVVLYHELGHFIDLRYQITNKLARVFALNKEEENHYAEFFADIFAAQYIGSASNYYLNYIAHKHESSYTHPSTQDRISLVESFLNNKDNDILNNLKEASNAITKNEIKSRRTLISENDFIEFIPPIINSNEELHSLFEVGWNLWNRDIKKFKERNITEKNKYNILNSLIEKSISNHMIMDSWKHVYNEE
jgi:hypothetical protein